MKKKVQVQWELSVNDWSFGIWHQETEELLEDEEAIVEYLMSLDSDEARWTAVLDGVRGSIAHLQDCVKEDLKDLAKTLDDLGLVDG